jgi:hypothetical protein
MKFNRRAREAVVRVRVEAPIHIFLPIVKNRIGLVTDSRGTANMSFFYRWKSP